MRYTKVAKGQPIDDAQLGLALGISATQSRELLQRDPIQGFIYRDERGRGRGFGGLAAAPMHHRFEVDDRILSTWCAWDSLFIPEILGRPARVVSPDPESDELVRLVVTPDRIESAEPEGAVVSFIMPDVQAFGSSAINVIAKFCHFIFFFSSWSSGERWIAKHPGHLSVLPRGRFRPGEVIQCEKFRAGACASRTIASTRHVDASHFRWQNRSTGCPRLRG